MLKQYRMRLLSLIEPAGLCPQEFRFETSTSAPATNFRIHFREPRLVFHIYVDPHNHHGFKCEYRQFNPTFSIASYIESFATSSVLLDRFRNWLTLHVRPFAEDERATDPWQTVHVEPLAFLYSLQVGADFLSEAELSLMTRAAADLTSRIEKTCSLTMAQVDVLRLQINHLISMSERMGRKDWVNLAIGALLGYAVQAALSPDITYVFFNAVDDFLRAIFAQPRRLLL